MGRPTIIPTGIQLDLLCALQVRNRFLILRGKKRKVAVVIDLNGDTLTECLTVTLADVQFATKVKWLRSDSSQTIFELSTYGRQVSRRCR